MKGFFPITVFHKTQTRRL